MRYLWCIIAFQYVLFVTAGVYVVKRGLPEKGKEEDPLTALNKNITKVDNDTLFEGDMRMPKKEADKLYQSDKKRDATIANSLDNIGDLWPKTIPYELHTNLGGDIEGDCVDLDVWCHHWANLGHCARGIYIDEMKLTCCATCKDIWKGGSDVIADAIAEITSKTCLKFTKRTNEDDFLFFLPRDGCWSQVGKHDGEQEISLPSDCWTKRIAIHEILHALGFLHEQARPDRDDFVKVFTENVEQDQGHNFDKYDETVVDSLGEGYDYKSIMHYWNKEFSFNDKDTIQKKDDPKFVLGVRDENGGLSVSDAKQLNMLYSCPQAAKKSLHKDKSRRRREIVRRIDNNGIKYIIGKTKSNKKRRSVSGADKIYWALESQK